MGVVGNQLKTWRKLKEVIQQTRKPKEKRQPGQRGVKCYSANFKPTTPFLSVGNEQRDVTAIPERMAFIPVTRCGAVDSLVDSFKRNESNQKVNGSNVVSCHFLICFFFFSCDWLNQFRACRDTAAFFWNLFPRVGLLHLRGYVPLLSSAFGINIYYGS